MLARLRSYLPTAALALLIVYFGVHAFTGDQGLLSSNLRDETLMAKTRELAALQAQREDLEKRARLCATPHFPPTCWRKGRAPC